MKKIAERVQTADIWFSPHTWTNGIRLLANLHLACAVSRCPYLEFSYDPPAWTIDRRDYLQVLRDRLMIDNQGYLHVPEKPGLGFDLDEEALSRYEVGSTQVNL